MKILFAAAAFGLVAGAAVAGEGGGNPYPYNAPAQNYSLQGYKAAPNAADNPYPFSVPGQQVNGERILQPQGSAAEVQSAGSLPDDWTDRNPMAPAPVRTAQPNLPGRSHG